MFERTLQIVLTDDPGAEQPAATRERLKGRFAPGAVRRMTQLGMLVGALVGELQPREEDAVVYTSQFGEARALEAFLDSFPTASPTLFQTSIHPSGVQQGLIARQQPLREFIPMAGGEALVAQALLAAVLSPAPRVILCGGEECGSWLVAPQAASERTFAYALTVGPAEAAGAAARLRLTPDDWPGAALTLPGWFDLLRQRRAHAGPVGPGWRLDLDWS
ncbi:beta-ketoacyl synthase chain length factor [Opitutus sp. ER46]|uniref:beta-ketoacyl synthase chain length factor n=1 Tax=Opitutus sp. ER46 TaxID=2161864 RepID=UPI000D2FD27F|nr:beta-ketoacyl synthase chain length factor [Opitutus sp. ER46]PTY00690.1 hypothetical protein DB354_01135 [Opitutus sp. ER46]